MNERLEEIKEMNGVINHKNPAWQEEIDWLINRVEKLERDYKDCNRFVGNQGIRISDLERENQRYKQALKEIRRQYEAEEEIDDHDFMWNVGQIASKTLEESK